MSFLYEEKASVCAHVDVLWRTLDTSDGIYLAAADACWDMIFTTSSDGVRVLLSGPSSRPTSVPYRNGNRNIGVRFTAGTYFTHVRPDTMCDRTVALPTNGDDRFELGDRTWPMPSYDDVDELLLSLVDAGLIAHDAVIDAVLSGADPPLSPRTVQRHFVRIIGKGPRIVRTIARAREAGERLRRGEPIADVAYQLGYADQSHLSRDVKRLTGYTPGQAQRRDEPI